MKNNKTYLIIVLLIIIFIMCIIVYKYCNDNYVEDVIIKKEEKDNIEKEEIVKEVKTENIEEKIYYFVDIKGAVNNPNVYKVEENSRVIDVINLAGGLKENADISIINLSKKVEDEMFIFIYTVEELQKYKEDKILISDIKKEIENDIIIDENNNALQQEIITNENVENKLININTATKEEFLTINGIGDAKAESIIKYREENGNFKTIDDIKNVSGIGDSLFESIKEYITV